MRVLLTTAVLLVAALLGPAKTLAQDVCPSDMAPAIESLSECVQHALAVGHIDSAGVANSLLAKLIAAEAAQVHDRPDVAIRLLEAFINEVTAQTGKHIDAMHATHMVMHAEMVIDALSG